MSFTVEDGTGQESSNAYIAVATADTHHADRGNSRWEEFSTAQKEQAIVRATDYVDKRFGRLFVGTRKLRQQALEWPRNTAFDLDGHLLASTDEIPRQLQRAVAEYALRAAIVNTLAPDPIPSVPSQDMSDATETRTTPQAGGAIRRKSTRVGPVETDTSYALPDNDGSRHPQSALVGTASIPEYPEADLWLEELLRSRGSITMRRGD